MKIATTNTNATIIGISFSDWKDMRENGKTIGNTDNSVYVCCEDVLEDMLRRQGISNPEGENQGQEEKATDTDGHGDSDGK